MTSEPRLRRSSQPRALFRAHVVELLEQAEARDDSVPKIRAAFEDWLTLRDGLSEGTVIELRSLVAGWLEHRRYMRQEQGDYYKGYDEN